MPVALVPWAVAGIGGFVAGRGVEGASDLIKYGLGGVALLVLYKTLK